MTARIITANQSPLRSEARSLSTRKPMEVIGKRSQRLTIQISKPTSRNIANVSSQHLHVRVVIARYRAIRWHEDRERKQCDGETDQGWSEASTPRCAFHA